MSDKLTINNCMVGSVGWDIHGNKYFKLVHVAVSGLVSTDEDCYYSLYRKAPLTPEVLEKCPLPDGFRCWVFSNVIEIHNGESTWYGKYISDLQLYFRSLGLEWDLTKLFE